MKPVASQLRTKLWNQTNCEVNLNDIGFSWSRYRLFTSGGAAWIEIARVMENHLITTIHEANRS